MLFTCVSNYSFLPKTTTGCNWKNIECYHPLTQLSFFGPTHPILHLAASIGGKNDIEEGCKNWISMLLQGQKIQYTVGRLVLVVFSICTIRSITNAPENIMEKMRQSNCFEVIWQKPMQWFWSWNIICHLGYMANWVGTCQWNPFHLYVIQWWLEQWVCGQSIDS